MDELEPFIAAVASKQALQLVTVAPDQRKTRAHSEDGTFAHSPPKGGNGAHSTEERLRAIAERAPEPARDLFREGLIGAKEAASLGPKNPTPDEAATVTAIAIEAAAIAKADAPKTKPEKRRTQEKVNAKVREGLGTKADMVRAFVLAASKVPFERWAEAANALPLETRRVLFVCLNDSLGKLP